MKIVTWNINSIRLRMPLLQDFVAQQDPDIICLQETKVTDELFPELEVRGLGYPYIIFRGQKSYNGVAILSKMPLIDPLKLDVAHIDDARHIAAILPDGTELHNFYIPAGGDEPDPVINPKFDHKLKSLDFIKDWFAKNRDPKKPMIAVGDFNIAPLEHDVWSHKQLLNVVSHTPIEVEKLSAMQDSLGWIDVPRYFVPEQEKLYSWWSYRNRDWKKSNRGRRLDHIWITEPLKDRLKSHVILSHMRDFQKPSDHVPVVMELEKIAEAG